MVNNRILLLILVLLIAMIFSSACSSRKLKGSISAEERLETAIKWFDDGHYLDAKTQFRVITLSHPGSRIVDKAQFYYAECHFYLKEYILAAAEYERLIKVFPNSEYIDDAQYKVGLCYFKLSPKYSLEQEYTNKAISQFQQFLEDYPNSNLRSEVEAKMLECRMQLARKKYSAAELYRKIGYLKSAIIYYNLVLDSYYDTTFAPKAQFWMADCHRRRGEIDEAKQGFETFMAKYPQHELADRANSRLEEINNKLGDEKANSPQKSNFGER